jgi:CPA1 family monovalent cation:H+ antiporter
MSHTLSQIELVLGLLIAAAVLITASRALKIEYPIVLVLGGLVLGLVPLPNVELEPDLVFLLFLPPIVFSAAYLTSIRDFKANAGPILELAIGLVLFTALVVAVVMHALVPDVGWGPAFVLGAIVAPSDAVATTAIAQRLGVPRRISTILEGESLVNDASALVLYQLSVAAVVTGTFSIGLGVLQFVEVAVGGVLIGLAVGWLMVRLLIWLDDPPVEILISLLAPYAAFLPADGLHVSGVLAALAAGLYAGRRSARAFGSRTRLQSESVWSMVIFVINGLLFLLIGLQVPVVLESITGASPGELIGLGVAASLAVIVARAVWVYPTAFASRMFGLSLGTMSRASLWRGATVISWAGMRGAVSLATALALPVATDSGAPFPGRSALIFLTFCVILVTLVGQGLTLPPLIKWLRIGADTAADAEELHARTTAVQAALDRIESLPDQWPGHLPLIDTLRAQYSHRASDLDEQNQAADGSADGPNAVDQELVEHRAIRRSVIDAERNAVIQLRDDGEISDDVLRRVERDLDLEQVRMDT